MNYIFSIWDIFGDIISSVRGKDPLNFKGFEQELTYIEEYRALVKEYQDILDAVFLNANSKQFITPDFWLNLKFTHLLKKLIIWQKETKILEDLPDFTFDDYSSLTVNTDWMLNNYPKKRQETSNYRSHIENLFIYKCKGEGRLSELFERDLEDEYETINEHLGKRGSIKIKSSPFLKGSKRDIVYKIFEENLNNWINKKIFMKKLNINYDEFRSIVSQIKKELAGQYLIENDRQNAYKMIKYTQNLS